MNNPQYGKWFYQLTDEELELARTVGKEVERQCRMLSEKYGQEYRGFGTGDNSEKFFVGACGELALSRYMKLPWTGRGFDNRKLGDVCGVEVKTRTSAWADLPLLKKYPDDRMYLLAIWFPPNVIAFRGWCWGYEGKKDEYARKDRDSSFTFYFVPRRSLKDPEELFERISIERESIIQNIRKQVSERQPSVSW